MANIHNEISAFCFKASEINKADAWDANPNPTVKLKCAAIKAQSCAH